MATKVPQDETCSRCSGTGNLPQFRHVVGGICFRCWGCGVDPRTATQLRAWLERARVEFKARTGKLATCPVEGRDRSFLVREIEMITKMGKENRARLDRLERQVSAGRSWAKDQVAR